ncbi:MAG: hypothetical protein RLY86_725 [Pseudomonadota bacterium]|jgi:uncharacterized protein (DUF924 family)
MTTDDPRLTDLLRFWFEEAGPTCWFAGGPAFDDRCRERMGPLAKQAAAGELDTWAGHAAGAVGLCLLLDQAPRNIHRGTPAMYATDAKALAVAAAAIDRGDDLTVGEVSRLFLYLPFEHAEDLEHQRRALRLFATRTTDPAWLDYAALHLAVIHRFGRFPHRNAILGRETTAEEAAWLAQPGAGF